MSNPKNDINFLRAKIKRLESLLNKKDTPTEQTLNDVSGTLKNLKDLIDPLDLQKKISDYDIDFSDLKGFRTGIDNGTNIPTGLSGKFADKNLFDGVKDDFTKIKTGDLSIATGLKGILDEKTPLTDFNKIKTGDLTDAVGLKGVLDAKAPVADLVKIKSGDLTDATGLKGLLDSKTAITDFNKLKDGDLEALGANGLKGILDGKATVAAVNLKANSDDVYNKTAADGRYPTAVAASGTFRTSAQVISDIGGFDFSAGGNNSINTRFGLHYTKTVADSRYPTATAASGTFRTSAQVNDAVTSHPSVTEKAKSADVYTKTAADSRYPTAIAASGTFRTSAQVTTDIAGFDFNSNANPTVTPILKFNDLSSSHITYTGSFNTLSASHINFTGSLTRLSQSHATYTGSLNTLSASHALFTGSFTTLSSSHVSRLGILDNHTSSINSFSSSHGFKLSSIAFSLTEEQMFKYASSAGALKLSYFAAANDPTTGYDKGKWYFTNTFPTGNTDYRLTSYSYQGYATAGQVSIGSSAGDKFNQEDFITYRKRLYTLGAGGTYSSTITQDSELLLQAGKTTIRSGTNNKTSPSLKVIGESSVTNGVSEDQGQLILQDEDNATGGLMLGYKYVDASNEYARIQAKNSAGAATDIYLNAAGGSVRVGRLNNNYLTDGAIELNYYGAGNRNSFIDFHSDDYYGYPGGNPSVGADGDYSGRVIRFSGIDGMMQIENKGLGGIRNKVSYGVGNIFDWYVDNTRLMFIKNTGQLWVMGGTAAGAGINVWNGDVALNLGHHASNENTGRIQVKSAGSAGSIGGTNYILKLNPDGGTVYSNNGIVSTSDERIKYDIKESILGLEFINKIKPVSYKYKIRDTIYTTGSNGDEVKIEKTGVRPHYGFIAQQVKEALGDNDFAGYIYEPSLDEHALRYDEFISPMVKAIQELSKENDYLKKKLEEKDKQLENILLRLSALESK